MEERIKLYTGLLATMSHEIRTPLNGVTGLLEVLFYDLDNISEDQRETLTLARESATAVQSAFNDLMDGTIILWREEKLHTKKFDLIELLNQTENVLNDSYWMTKQIPVKLLIESEREQIMIEADKSFISNMFTWFFGIQSHYGGSYNQTAKFLIPISVTKEFVSIIISNVTDSENSQIKELHDGETYGFMIKKIIDMHAGTLAFHADGDGKTYAEITLPLEQKK